MRPLRLAHAPKVDIGLFYQGGVGEVRALPTPIVKLFRAVMGRNEFPVSIGPGGSGRGRVGNATGAR